MSKKYEKMEYPSKKIASTFWWDTFAILFFVGLFMYVFLFSFTFNLSRGGSYI